MPQCRRCSCISPSSSSIWSAPAVRMPTSSSLSGHPPEMAMGSFTRGRAATPALAPRLASRATAVVSLASVLTLPRSPAMFCSFSDFLTSASSASETMPSPAPSPL
ncbi:hypothetical protein ZIOFF_041195 [Zingiber officinale]|uniref:Uncharacterized protein n=1 Tax=Zingiber officinale TaxID=94328 RepID=A0A8J5G7A3_ZINOF|nr:hypothetical protein ZIOFF_041195 [Zingiber officinale]